MTVPYQASSEFRHRIALQRRFPVPNDRGGFDYEWRFVQWVWASVKPIRGQQFWKFWQGDQQRVLGTHLINCLWFPGLTSDEHRFLFDGRILGIVAVVNIEEAAELYEILAIESKTVDVHEAGVLPLRGGVDA